MSLVEVIIYAALSALLLSVLGGVFYTGFQTQAAAGSRDVATNAAQVTSSSLQTGVRRASTITVSDKLLKARVATGATGWQCVSWVVTADNKLKYKTAAVAITDTDYANVSWKVLASGVTGGLVGGAAFVGTSTQLSYSLVFTSGIATVPVAGLVSTSASGDGTPVTCS